MAGENLVNRPKTVRAWCENFWYHYKWHSIVAMVLIVTVAVASWQFLTRTTYDYTVMLATESVEFSSLQINALQKELAACGKDRDGDGKVNVLLVDCTFNEQESGYQIIMAKKQKLQSLIVNEEDALILIADPGCYTWLNDLGKKNGGEGFMADTGLPEGEGRYYTMTDSTFVRKAKAAVSSDFIWPEKLVISRRRIEGTLFEDRKGMDEKVAAADAFIAAVMADGAK